MAHHQTIHAARENGAVGKTLFAQRLNVDQVIDLLVSGGQHGRHPAIRINANRLLDLMSRDAWEIRAGSHIGGFGGGRRSPDLTQHITLRVNGGGYHLRHDARGHLFEITGPGMLPLPPALSPGTPIETR